MHRFRGLSADFPGYAITRVNEELGDDVLPIFAQGCGGTINGDHVDTGHKKAEETGRKLGDAVLRAMSQMTEIRADKFALRSKTIMLPCHVPSMDLWEEAGFIFRAPENYDEKAANKAFKEDTPRILNDLGERLKQVEPFDSATLTARIKPWIADSGIGFGKVMMPFRLAMVGEMKGPDVFDIAALLGKEECLKRLEKAVATMDQK